MSRLGVWLAEAVNNRVSPQEMHRELDRDKLGVHDYQMREYREAQRVCPEFGARWDVRGRRVLDVGCGLGGKPLYYADLGARSVTAIDIRPDSVKASAALYRDRGQHQIVPLISDAAHMPFQDDSFDVIISINVLEHVDDLRGVLAECKRVLCPGGLMFFHFPPFYSPWGAHLEGWINFPWPHVFFSDATLIEAACRVEMRRRNNANYIAAAQVDWNRAIRLPELNRATARQVFNLLCDLDITIVESHMLPFGRHYLGRRGISARTVLRLLVGLAGLPVLRELVTTKMVFVLTKS